MHARNNNICLKFKNIEWFSKNHLGVNKTCFPTGEVRSANSYSVIGKSSENYVSNKAVKNLFLIKIKTGSILMLL